MVTFIVDGKNNILHPTTKSDMVYRWLKRGEAKVLKGGLRRGEPILIQVFKKFNRPTKDNSEFRIGIDPGYKHIGYCIYKINTKKQNITKLISGEVETRTSEVTKNLLERKRYRNLRRHYRRKNIRCQFNSCKFRKPIWKNRSKHKFQPTHWHLINSHKNLLKWIFDRIPFEQSKLHIEYNSFDIQKILNPAIYNWEYQKGDQYGFENVKSYVRSRDNYICQMCGKKVNNIMNHIHHIIWRENGGSDRPNNLMLVCMGCHRKIHKGLLKCTKPSTNNFRDIGVLNSCMKYLFQDLENNIPIQDTYGSFTKVTRQLHNFEKNHSTDASIIALSDSLGFTEEFKSYNYLDFNVTINFKQYRRHVRYWVQRYEDRKYYRNNQKGVIAWNRKKREGQTKDSLVELRRKNPGLQVIYKPGRVIYRKSNTNILFRPGDTFKCDKGTDTVRGWASSYRLVHGEWYSDNRQRECLKLLNNSGLCVV